MLPRTEPEDERLFKLLKRAYIEARYSKSYRITLDELTKLREQVRVLAVRVREASIDKLATHLGQEAIAMTELPPEPREEDSSELPVVPPLDDARAVECWRDAIAAVSREAGMREGEQRGRERGLQEGEARGREAGLREGEARGEQRGRERGLQEGEVRGEERGRQAGRAQALIDVLALRGIPLSDADVSRIMTSGPSQLDEWWSRALTVQSAPELFKARTDR